MSLGCIVYEDSRTRGHGVSLGCIIYEDSRTRGHGVSLGCIICEAHIILDEK